MGQELVAGPLSSGITLDFLRIKAPDLARDIICKIDKASSLADKYGLEPAQWEALRSSEFFLNLCRRMQADLAGAQGLQERIRIKALYALDETMVLELAAMGSNAGLAAGNRIDAIKELRELAGLVNKGNAGNANAGTAAQATSGPLVVIKMGDNREVHVGGEVVTP